MNWKECELRLREIISEELKETTTDPDEIFNETFLVEEIASFINENWGLEGDT